MRDPAERADGTRHEDKALWRSAAQVDVDRVWYSPEFRRLGGVTQVIPPQEDFGFHDRLIHSVKVAQVAATIARKLLHDKPKRSSVLAAAIRSKQVKLTDWIDPDYCYVAGLAHDIGHPPFGHAGEQAIQHTLEHFAGLKPADARAAADLRLRSFEGNAQSIRIVARTSFRKKREAGLNLTLRSIAAIGKYPWLRDKHPASVKKLERKWSFYDSESGLLSKLVDGGYVAVELRSIPKQGGRPNETVEQVLRVHRWPEAEIMDWADDVSYAVHDLEDFYRFGRIPLHRIRAVLNHVPDDMLGEGDRVDEWMDSSFDFAQDDQEVRGALTYARSKMSRAIDEDGQNIVQHVPQAFVRLDHLVDKMPTNRFDGTRNAHERLQNFASELITTLIDGASLTARTVNGQLRVQVVVDPVTRLLAEFFKALCQYYVINSSTVGVMQRGQRSLTAALITELGPMVEEGLFRSSEDTTDRTLPARLREYVAEELPEEMLREVRDAVRASSSPDARDVEPYGKVLAGVHIAVVDFICGLKDAQASRLGGQITGSSDALSLRGDWLDV